MMIYAPCVSEIEQCINEHGNRRALGENDDRPENKEHDKHWHQPPPLVLQEESKELTDDSQPDNQAVQKARYDAHCLTSLASPRIFFDQIIAQDQDIHPASGEGLECLLRGVHDRLALEIEGRIEDDRHARGLPKPLDQPVISWVDVLLNRLESPGAVDVGNGRDGGSFVFPDVHDIKHEASRVVLRGLRERKVVLGLLTQDRRSEWPEWLAEFDLHVDEVLHVCPAGVRKNAPVTQSAGTPFEPPLDPPDNHPFLKPVHNP